MQKPTKLPALNRLGRLPHHLKFTDEKEKPKRLTPRQIEEAAQFFIQSDRSNLRTTVLELLYEFVALTEATLFRLVFDRVAISKNPASFHHRLNVYVRDGLIEPISRSVLKQALRAGLPQPDAGSLRAYRLGPVGVEIAKIKFVTEVNAPLIVIDAEDYQAHDLLCAEAMFKMQTLWADLAKSEREDDRKKAGQVEVRGPRALTIWDSENQKAILAPDGLLIKHDLAGNFQRAYLVEYHNSNAMMHVKNKVAKYENLAKPEYRWLWQTWGLAEMPWIVALYRQPVTLEHYSEELARVAMKEDVKALYGSTFLADVWAGKLSIAPIRYK